jgi:hypothetical protein
MNVKVPQYKRLNNSEYGGELYDYDFSEDARLYHFINFLGSKYGEERFFPLK